MEEAYLIGVHITTFQTRIYSLPKPTALVLPSLSIVSFQPILGLTKPIGLERSSLGNKVHLKSILLEDVVWM